MGQHRIVKTGLAVIATAVCGLATADGRGVWSQYDRDRDGYLNQGEFSEMKSYRPSGPEYDAIWQFERVDGNQDGLVDQGEMIKALQEQARVKGLSR